MAKKLALVALLLGIAALFLPLSQATVMGMTFTKGIFVGNEKSFAGLAFTGPATLAALFGVLLGRTGFRRGLGALHLLFGLAGLGMCALVYSEPRTGVDLGLGMHLALVASILVLVAGLIGLVKPDPK